MPPLDCAGPEKTPFRGWLRTTKDVLLVFEAARRGIIPRVIRRFKGAEKRKFIQSGVVLVFTEAESGIKRWTDPFLWTPSRMSGNFFVYREREVVQETSESPYACSDIRSSGEGYDAELETDIYGGWVKGHGLKANGLMKKTISLEVDGIVHHLVSYYDPSDVRAGVLQTPSTIPALRDLEISSEVLVNVAKLRHPPHTEIDQDRKFVFVSEFDDATSTDPLYPNGDINRDHINMSPRTSYTYHQYTPSEKASLPSSNKTSTKKPCSRKSTQRRVAQKSYKPHDQHNSKRTVSRYCETRSKPDPVVFHPSVPPKAPNAWSHPIIASPTSSDSCSSASSPISPSSLSSPRPSSPSSCSLVSSYKSSSEDVYWEDFSNCQWNPGTDWDAFIASSQPSSYQFDAVQPSPMYSFDVVPSVG